MELASWCFYLFSALMISSALAVISVRNPVHSVLFLIFCFFNASALFLLIGAEYVAMTLVIVYVGAVAVLFLFVVMMLNIDIATMRQGFLKYLPVGSAVAALLLGEMVLIFMVMHYSDPVIAGVSHPMPEATEVSNTLALGRILYTDYVYAFQLSGVILLVAMIGAIVLTLRHSKASLKQNIAKQVARDRKTAIQRVQVQPGQGA